LQPVQADESAQTQNCETNPIPISDTNRHPPSKAPRASDLDSAEPAA
jgi:hypothetical protein